MPGSNRFALICVISGLLAAAPAFAADAVVVLNMTMFQPQSISIPVGTNVIFMNKDTMEHDVYSATGDVFDLQVQEPGASTSHVFMKPGTYKIGCTIHSNMMLTVTVK